MLTLASTNSELKTYRQLADKSWSWPRPLSLHTQRSAETILRRSRLACYRGISSTRCCRQAERTGSWQAAIGFALTVQLPKADGGLRPIGLFPTVVRIWMRARAIVARQWEELTAAPSFYGSAGMDLEKAFEYVRHHLLAREAAEHGYSLTVLRLSLAAYRTGACRRGLGSVCQTCSGEQRHHGRVRLRHD